ncbi:glycerophosphoryl diester phosphodiesterase membrane domain-containing protein [Nocardiopsis mangrovi]|uniref:Glycerophosphoryl diester phosphodiesterase membrane domain-containing protein n=1 Tax=Nocardiopsis mangrovi TaxID=1179818 RepID=A0ABV9DTN1_9ACTN
MTQDDGQERREPDRSPEPGADGPAAAGAAPSSWAVPGGGAPEPPPSGWAAPGAGPGHDQGHGYGQQGHTQGQGYPQEHGYGQPGYGQQGPAPGQGQGPYPGQGPGPAFAPPSGYAPPGPGGPGGYAPPGHGPHPGYGPPGYGAAPPGYGQPAAPRPGIVALRPLTLGDIFNGAFGYIRNNPKATLGMTTVIVALVSLLPAVGAGSLISDYTAWLEEPPIPAGEDDGVFPMSPFTLATQFGGSILSFVGSAVLTGLLAAVVGLAVLGRKLTAAEAWAAAKPRLGAVLGVAVLLFLLGTASVALLVGVIVGAIALAVALTIWIGVVAGILGLVAWAAANVWIYVRTSMAMPVTVLERIGPGSALARSWRLTRRGWWRVFGILLLASFLGNAVASVLSGPFSILGGVADVFIESRAVADTAYAAAVFLGSVIAGTVTTPFITGVTTLLYVDLRMRREGLDLRLQAAAQSGAHAGPEIYLPGPPAPAGPPPGYPQQAGPGGPVPGAPA